MDNLKCPGVTKNHEVIHLVKSLHINAGKISQMSVVTIYAHTITHIKKQTILQFIFRCSGNVTVCRRDYRAIISTEHSFKKEYV